MRAAIIAIVLLVCGCTTQTTGPDYYLMRPRQDLPSGELSPSRTFSLGSVAIAPYLDQPGLVIETADGTLRPARQHFWAEPVYNSVNTLLSVEISRARGEDLLPSKLSKGATVVDIRIDELHGTEDGQAKLVAYWWLRRDDQVQKVHRFAQTRALRTDGYGALVDAEQALLIELAGQIAASLTPISTPE